MALAMDVMQDFFEGRIDAAFFVTSDSDFYQASQKLNSCGGLSYILWKSTSPDLLKRGCTRFFEFSEPTTSPPPQNSLPSQKPLDPIPTSSTETGGHLKKISKILIDATASNPGKKFLMSDAGVEIRKILPEFTPKSFGFSTLTKLIENLPELKIQHMCSPTGMNAYRWIPG